MADSDSNVVVINSQKGGQGKTTVAINVANELGHRGHDVLAIDLDPTGHYTSFIGFESLYYDDDQPDIEDYLFNDATFKDLLVGTSYAFDLIPATEHLAEVETRIYSEIQHPLDALNPLAHTLKRYYDYIIIDTAAAKNRLLASILNTADDAIIPARVGDGRSVIQKTINDTIADLRKPNFTAGTVSQVNVIAMVPTFLNSTIKNHTKDRKLIAALAQSPDTADATPNFAYVPPEHFELIDNGELDTIPKPGIRKADPLSEQIPLRAVDDDHHQLYCFEELADIVEHGGVKRNPEQTPVGQVLENPDAINTPETTHQAPNSNTPTSNRPNTASSSSSTPNQSTDDHTRSL